MPRKPQQESEQWRQFWNSIGGSSIDPTSLRRKPDQIAQGQLETYVEAIHANEFTYKAYSHLSLYVERRGGTPMLAKSLEALEDLSHKLVVSVREAEKEIVLGIRSKAPIEPGERTAMLVAAGKSRRKNALVIVRNGKAETNFFINPKEWR